jgi:hypothetical protein
MLCRIIVPSGGDVPGEGRALNGNVFASCRLSLRRDGKIIAGYLTRENAGVDATRTLQRCAVVSGVGSTAWRNRWREMVFIRRIPILAQL